MGTVRVAPLLSPLPVETPPMLVETPMLVVGIRPRAPAAAAHRRRHRHHPLGIRPTVPTGESRRGGSHPREVRGRGGTYVLTRSGARVCGRRAGMLTATPNAAAARTAPSRRRRGRSPARPSAAASVLNRRIRRHRRSSTRRRLRSRGSGRGGPPAAIRPGPPRLLRSRSPPA